jgi:protein-S-isoprenylcysteine O-methyltransferase Ste14
VCEKERYANRGTALILGAGLALAGALFHQSFALLGYLGVFLLLTHVFVVAYEEPTLRWTFAKDYEAYCAKTGRWWPKR